MEINNLKELKQRKVLELHDRLVFHHERPDFGYPLVFKAWVDHLCGPSTGSLCCDSGDEDFWIYKELGLDVKQTFILADRCFGYKALGKEAIECKYPHCKKEDYKALTRLVEVLFRIIEGEDFHTFIEPYNPVEDRFELMDL